jgi:hypothetical protein
VNDKQQFKLVVTYDRNRNEYSIPAHNQTPEEVDGYVAAWSHHLRPGCSFIVLDQTKRHRTEEAKNCRACRETVTRSAHLEPQPKFVRNSE